MSKYQKGKAKAIEKAQFWQDFFALAGLFHKTC